jgi:small subunit ribosomal protein S3
VGHKVHPNGFRLGVIRGWHGKWYAEHKDYTRLLHEDVLIRRTIQQRLADAGVPRIEIERNPNQVSVTIHAAKPGIVIGRGGAKVEELKQILEKATGKRVKISISEIRQPELDAFLVAKNVAEQIERRVSYKRAVKQAANRSMQRGAKGVKIIASGRLGGAEMSRRETERTGRVPLHTLRADIDYGLCEAHTTFGRIGVKVWIYRGDILPEPKRIQEPLAVREIRAEAEAAAAAAAAAAAEQEAPATVEEANEVMAAAIAQAEAAAAQAEAARVRAEAAQAAAPADQPPPATDPAQQMPLPPAPVEAPSAGLSAEELLMMAEQRARLAEAEAQAAAARAAALQAQAEAERMRAELTALREQQRRQQQPPPAGGDPETGGSS